MVKRGNQVSQGFTLTKGLRQKDFLKNRLRQDAKLWKYSLDTKLFMWFALDRIFIAMDGDNVNYILCKLKEEYV